MQVGIDVGATKIESVVLEKNGNEKHRSRISCPKEYTQIITAIRDIHKQLEKEFKQELPIGVCHPGVHSPQTGLVKNAPNINWLEKNLFKMIYVKHLEKKYFVKMMQTVLLYQNLLMDQVNITKLFMALY